MPLDHKIQFERSSRERPLILVTNDDGVGSSGLTSLVEALKKVGEVLTVAPASEQSTASHSLTLHRPLRCNEISKNMFAVDGTPTDCINIAMNYVLRGKKPDLVFSGINRGPNLGDDIHYSGTVSAAVEGGIIGIPSVAMSVTSLEGNIPGNNNFKFEGAAKFGAKLAAAVLKNKLPRGVILNVNVPNVPENEIKGHRITFQGKKNYSNMPVEKTDPRGGKYYWLCGEETGFDSIEGSDCNAVSEGWISITPVRVDMTDFEFLKTIENWKI